MCSGDVVSLAPKACSGKCRASCPNAAPRVWVVAACEGMISVFERDTHGWGTVPMRSVMPVFASLDQFRQSMEAAEGEHAFDQLVLIGSAGDIAWMHSSMPPEAARHIAAEIKYPLLAQWFREPLPLKHLPEALSVVLD